MSHAKPEGQQGRITHEQQLRMLERKDDLPKAGEADAALRRTAEGGTPANPIKHPDARQSEFPVSQHGMNQERRRHKGGGSLLPVSLEPRGPVRPAARRRVPRGSPRRPNR